MRRIAYVYSHVTTIDKGPKIKDGWVEMGRTTRTQVKCINKPLLNYINVMT